jgi:chemotaxis protein methyltransferase CheR
LRQRIADIPLLLQWFMERLSRKLGKPPVKLSQNMLKALQNYHWPGNVRELKNMIESALITGQLNKIKLEPLQVANEPSEGFKPLEEMERDYILKVLKAKKWKVQGKNSAAEILRMNPNTLRARINKLGITKPTS